MAVDSETRIHGQVCQICGDGVGNTVEGDVFVACDVCGFPVCRPCYDYERKHGNQCCPQCKTKYKRHKGSAAIHGEEVDEGDGDDASDFDYQDQKQKAGDRMIGWHVSYEKGGNHGIAKYDSGEIARNSIPMLMRNRSQEVRSDLF